MCLIVLGALCLSQLTIFYGTPFILSSIYMHKEGKQKSNDIKYAQVNKAKLMIYCRFSKLNGTKTFFFFFFFSYQLIIYNYGNVDYWITFSKADNFC